MPIKPKAAPDAIITNILNNGCKPTFLDTNFGAKKLLSKN